MNARRILLLAESPYFGGIASHILSIPQAFAGDARYAFVVATLPGRRRDEQFLFDRGHALDIAVHGLAMDGTFDRRVFGELRRLVREQRIDLVHTHNYRATLIAARARLDVPLINTCHGFMVAPNLRLRLWQWAELRAMRRFPQVLACSDHVCARLIEKGLAPDRVRTVRNAFAAPAPLPPAASREPYGIAPDMRLVLFAGRLVHGKGVHLLIEALTRARGWTALIAGDGPLRGKLEEQARRLGVSAHFAGHVMDPLPLHRMADAVALPSEMEALPMTLIEAAACERAVIATHVGGIPEIVVENETGLLFPPNDATALAAALEQLNDAARRTRMGNAARARYETIFCPARMAHDLARAYDEALRR
ncbi:MAG TPA: glycosyltransferase [Candidatus Hydrogenedentes bacterium]|nr:glycosyltransferase [Candidatus Hydrogenedentota bacterium]